MKKRVHVLVMIASAALFLAACNFPLARSGPSEEELLATSVAQTVEALNHQIPTQESLPTVTLPSLPTITPGVTATSIVILPATATPIPCNKAQFVSETIVDNTVIAPGAAFTKTWRFKNVGTCTWNTNYKLIFVSGDAMGGVASKNLTANVAPNGNVDISVNLTAPTTAGTYKGNWALQADDGQNFANFWVQIKVETATFAVTSVNTNLANVSPGACPYSYGVQINITASAPGTVTYYTERSVGGVSATKSVVFAAAGTKTENLTWDGLTTGAYWLSVYIDHPNNQLFGPFNFSVTCP